MNPGQLDLPFAADSGDETAVARLYEFRRIHVEPGHRRKRWRLPRSTIGIPTTALNKALLGFHRTHAFTTNGTCELPLGPNRAFLSGGPGFVQRLVERWQLGGIFSWISGAPLSITAPYGQSRIQRTAFTVTTPNIVGRFSEERGESHESGQWRDLLPGHSADHGSVGGRCHVAATRSTEHSATKRSRMLPAGFFS